MTSASRISSAASNHGARGFSIVRPPGHGRLQPNNRIDPGPNWPWSEYYDLIDAHCNGGAPVPEPEPEPEPQPEPMPGDPADAIVIDSNNDKNDAAKGLFKDKE